MVDCSNLISKFLFILTLSLFLFQLYTTIYLYDLSLLSHTYFTQLRWVYYLLFSLTTLSFLRTSLTDPGYITDDNNVNFISLYRISRMSSVQRGLIYNERTNRIIRPVDPDYSSDTDCEFDTQTYPMPHNNDLIAQKYKEDFNIQTKLCPKCHMIRVPQVHHCPDCHHCVYMMDHHCVWLNNCIGQFNQKFFVLFCFYLLLTSCLGFWFNVKYLLMIDFMVIVESYRKGVIIFTTIFINVAFVLFMIKLLWDQYCNVEENAVVYDFKENKVLEIRSKMEVLCEIFGEKRIGLYWFVPIKTGGLTEVYESIDEIKKTQ